MTDVTLFKQMMWLRQTGGKAALATVIRTKGSTPRKTGAKMLVYPNGELLGTIGGGCGEAAVIEEAWKVIETGIPSQYRIDLTSGLLYEDGGICGGIMDVFIEPI